MACLAVIIQTNPGDLFRAQACERCAEWQQALSLLDDTSLHNHSKWKATLRRCCNLVVVTFSIFCLHVFMLLYVWSWFLFFEASNDLKVEDMQIVVFGDVSAMHLCISACVKVHRCAFLLVEVEVDVFCRKVPSKI